MSYMSKALLRLPHLLTLPSP